MNCHDISEYWDDYRDGTLDSQDRGRFAAHLSACSRCAGLYERETGYLAELNDAAGAPQDAGFVDAVMARWLEPPRPLRVARWRVPAAAALVASSSINNSPAFTTCPSRTRMRRTTAVSMGCNTLVRLLTTVRPGATATMSS